MVISYDILGRPDSQAVLSNLRESIRDDGFLFLEESRTNFDATKKGKALFDSLKLTTVTYQFYDKKVFVLLRPTNSYEQRKTTVIQVTEKNFTWVETLKAALAKAEETNTFVYLVCQGEEMFGAQGFINCIKNEAGGKFARMIFIQDKRAEKFSLTGKSYVEQLKKDLICNVMNSSGVWGCFRHLRLDNQTNGTSLQVEHAYVNALTKGDLASLKWIEGPLSRDRPDPKDKKQELCTVYYAPINFRDVMLSSGKLGVDALPGDLPTQDCILGLEVS